MAKILVNDVEQSTTLTPATWGELLDQLDQTLAPQGEVVTVARFDGVEEPSFRKDDLAGRTLDDWATIEVSSDSPRALLDACLIDAEKGVSAMGGAVVRLGEMFRGHDLAVANQGLAHVAEDLRALVSLTEALGGPLGIELHQLQSDGRSVQEHLNGLGTMLESLVDAQQASDWLTVADILEYDLAPALSEWGAIFSTLRSYLPETDGAGDPIEVAG